MKPDDQGRYGFNVKGGAESSTPVTVSKVAPNAPADRTTPRLSEGDQVRRPARGGVEGVRGVWLGGMGRIDEARWNGEDR